VGVLPCSGTTWGPIESKRQLFIVFGSSSRYARPRTRVLSNLQIWGIFLINNISRHSNRLYGSSLLRLQSDGFLGPLPQHRSVTLITNDDRTFKGRVSYLRMTKNVEPKPRTLPLAARASAQDLAPVIAKSRRCSMQTLAPFTKPRVAFAPRIAFVPRLLQALITLYCAFLAAFHAYRRVHCFSL
jgi:hypothetical protein